MFADFYNSSNVVFSIEIPENVCEQWEITETNNWIGLLIFDDTNQFLFLFFQPAPKQLIILLKNFCYIFYRRYLIIKQNDSQNVTTQMHYFDC